MLAPVLKLALPATFECFIDSWHIIVVREVANCEVYFNVDISIHYEFSLRNAQQYFGY